eukprot:Nitzschia sp. Nitz4//scaffold135_size62275//31377//32198//NITZ4_006352-RA/size62275-augustus-gene-0.3-mRNA-1//1//CDS//3329535569//6667//frame0
MNLPMDLHSIESRRNNSDCAISLHLTNCKINTENIMKFDADLLDFQTANTVYESWNQVKKIPNYEDIAGELLFRKIFEIDPSARDLYSFDVDDEEEIYKSEAFKEHARLVVLCLEQIVNMLGPDLEPFLVELQEMGARHVSYGVVPSQYPVVEQALMITLETALGTKWTPYLQHCWKTVYGLISCAMLSGAESVECKELTKVIFDGRTYAKRLSNSSK